MTPDPLAPKRRIWTPGFTRNALHTRLILAPSTKSEPCCPVMRPPQFHAIHVRPQRMALETSAQPTLSLRDEASVISP